VNNDLLLDLKILFIIQIDTGKAMQYVLLSE